MIKLISKLLALQLRTKIDKLVSDFQTAFIQGRFIFESFIAASEVVSFCRRSKTPRILCKIDFEKAWTVYHGSFCFHYYSTGDLAADGFHGYNLC